MALPARDSLRKMLVLLLLGFSSGLPFSLTGVTLQAWAVREGLKLESIGLFALLGVPYTLKLLWAPFFDLFPAGRFGRRRSAMLMLQLLLILTVVALSFSSPKSSPLLFVSLALVLTFFSASQDIVIDGYRAEILDADEYGSGVALGVLGYRVGMIASGAFALVLSDRMSFPSIYLLLSALFAIGMLGALFGTEEGRHRVSGSAAFIEPLKLLFRRRKGLEVAAFVVLYKLGDAFAAGMILPCLYSLGFSGSEVGLMHKLFGPLSLIGGSLFAGRLMSELPLRRALLFFGIAQGASILMYLALVLAGHSRVLFALAVVVENFCAGLGTTAFLAFLIALCDRRFSATQYAALTSLVALARVLAESSTGFAAAALGWPRFFIAAFLLSVPALLLLSRFDSWEVGSSTNSEGGEARA